MEILLQVGSMLLFKGKVKISEAGYQNAVLFYELYKSPDGLVNKELWVYCTRLNLYIRYSFNESYRRHGVILGW